MGVKNTHSDYVKMKSEWQKCIDFMTSEKAVHDATTTYLSALSGQDDTQYLDYVNRAPVVLIAKRSNKAMVGMVTRKDPVIREVDSVEDLLESISSTGNNFVTYQTEILSRFNTTGRVGTLIDVPSVGESMTVAQAEEMGIAPRFVKYNELDIINWRKEVINNVEQLVMIVLREEVDDITDEFDWTVEYQYRVLDLHDGMYRVRLFDESEHLVQFDNGEYEIYPQLDGQPMTFIPFVIHGGIDVLQPPLNEVVDLNKHHYQLGADQVWGLRMCATPTPFFFGVDPNDEDFPAHVGGGVVIGAADTECQTGFREFSGAGMQAVADKLSVYEDSMAKLSVQFATDNESDVSATESTINQGNATSSLAGQVRVISGEFTKLMKIVAQWSGQDSEDVKVELNTDFMPAGISAPNFQALLNAYLNGTISYTTYYENLQKGEIANSEKSAEEEKTEIDNSMPPGMEG